MKHGHLLLSVDDQDVLPLKSVSISNKSFNSVSSVYKLYHRIQTLSLHFLKGLPDKSVWRGDCV